VPTPPPIAGGIGRNSDPASERTEKCGVFRIDNYSNMSRPNDQVSGLRVIHPLECRCSAIKNAGRFVLIVEARLLKK
jgi:hypothetical protein